MILRYGSNMLYLHCFRQMISCGEENGVKVKTTTSAYSIKVLTKKVLNERFFWFAGVDVEVHKELYKNFRKMTQRFVVKGVTDVPECMNEYEEATGGKVKKNSIE